MKLCEINIMYPKFMTNDTNFEIKKSLSTDKN